MGFFSSKNQIFFVDLNLSELTYMFYLSTCTGFLKQGEKTWLTSYPCYWFVLSHVLNIYWYLIEIVINLQWKYRYIHYAQQKSKLINRFVIELIYQITVYIAMFFLNLLSKTTRGIPGNRQPTRVSGLYPGCWCSGPVQLPAELSQLCGLQWAPGGGSPHHPVPHPLQRSFCTELQG